ncbi:EAL domain-containing protein [Xanthobacteraceae bacterium A53D]
MEARTASGPRRSRIIIIAVLLAVIGAIMPIAAVLYASWSLALKTEQKQLQLFASRALSRADITFEEARRVLLASATTRAPPCSPEHLEQMRRLTFAARGIQEIGYFQGDLLKCTSWGGPISTLHPRPVPAFITADGIGFSLDVRPLVHPDKPMLAMHLGGYDVLIDPARLLDIIVEPGISLALANDKRMVVAEINDPPPELVSQVIADPRDGMTEDYLYAVARQDGWIAVASVPRTAIAASLRREQFTLLPVGAFIAIFIVGIVIWLSRQRLSPLAELAAAVREKEFVVHYQPLIELSTGACIGAEALVRWRRPDGSRIRPDLFLPLAEESGLILPITDQVIEAVVNDLGPLLAETPALHIAINLCADDLRTGRVLPVIEQALENTGVRKEQIWLEATERGFLDIEAARATIIKARAAGHRVAIDDFGTGYSSLQYLQELPLDALKIDKSFVDTIGRDAATSSVTLHIIDMAKTLNLHIVAEGVEEKEQLDYLVGNEVGYGQGWLFARPLPAAEFIAYQARNREKHGMPNVSFPAEPAAPPAQL